MNSSYSLCWQKISWKSNYLSDHFYACVFFKRSFISNKNHHGLHAWMGQQLTANRSQQVEQVTVASGMCFLYVKPVCLFFLFPGTWRSLLWISVHEALSESQKGLLTPLTSLNTLTSAHKICQRSPFFFFFLLHIVYLFILQYKVESQASHVWPVRLLTVSPGRLARRSISDGMSPPLSLLEVGERVLDQCDPKALLHSVPGHSGAHPAPLERVEIGCKVSADVRAVRPSVRPTADTVGQVKNHLSPAGWRGDSLNGQGALRQAHRVADPVVEHVGELPVQHAHEPIPLAGWVRITGVFLHPGRRVRRVPEAGERMAVRCTLWFYQPAVGPFKRNNSILLSSESLPSDWEGEWQWWSWRRAQNEPSQPRLLLTLYETLCTLSVQQILSSDTKSYTIF